MDNLFEQTLLSISEMIKINSEQTQPEKGMPFGRGAAECLEKFLSLASSFGFQTVNYDNYAGEVIFGEGEDFGVLAHLDVVPAGNGWTKEPFGGEIDYTGKRLYGRGAMDDKGPAVILLYCLKSLKDEGFEPKKRIRLIVGCNEESGWQCIDYFKAHSTMPETGFSPDADFPVIYAEKGILQIKFTFPRPVGFKEIKGGERGNMVCDLCEVTADENTGKLNALAQAYPDREISYANGKLTVKGKSAHGSTPEAGINTILPALDYIGLERGINLLFEDGFNLSHLEDETGRLTFSPNVISSDSHGVHVICDIRFPATYSRADVLGAIEKTGVKYEVTHYQAPLYNDKDCPLIKTLSDTYCEVTGKKMKPIAIGGGTYARALKCGVAFGPEEEGEENVIHQPDEYITFEKIEKCLKIYKLALTRLTK